MTFDYFGSCGTDRFFVEKVFRHCKTPKKQKKLMFLFSIFPHCKFYEYDEPSRQLLPYLIRYSFHVIAQNPEVKTTAW